MCVFFLYCLLSIYDLSVYFCVSLDLPQFIAPDFHTCYVFWNGIVVHYRARSIWSTWKSAVSFSSFKKLNSIPWCGWHFNCFLNIYLYLKQNESNMEFIRQTINWPADSVRVWLALGPDLMDQIDCIELETEYVQAMDDVQAEPLIWKKKIIIMQ